MNFKEKVEFENLERDIESLEAKKLKYSQELSDGQIGGHQLFELGNKLAAVVEKIESKTNRWLELSEYQ